MKITHEYKMVATYIGNKPSEQKFKEVLDDMAKRGYLLAGYSVYRGGEHHMIFTKIEQDYVPGTVMKTLLEFEGETHEFK